MAREKSQLVWDKETIGMGKWVRGQHELLLIATKGNPPLPPTVSTPASVIRERRREHSRKPEASYAIIERIYCGTASPCGADIVLCRKLLLQRQKRSVENCSCPAKKRIRLVLKSKSSAIFFSPRQEGIVQKKMGRPVACLSGSLALASSSSVTACPPPAEKATARQN
jgi:hypothetical protein